tara:strand:- start:1390 stop:2145 length:756 start_codon:yes stop_codon:yes gene_type:complete
MELNLKNKIIVISGSSKGIGKSIAEILLHEGCKVVINGRNKLNLLKTKNELSKISKNIISIDGDVSKSATINKIKKITIKKWGKIDGIVANASSLENTKNKDSAFLIKYNFEIVYNFVNNLIPSMKKNDASIVIIGSIAGLEDIGAPFYYTVFKSTLSSYVKSMSRKLSEKNIRINLVSPGNILFKNGNWEKKLNTNKSKINRMIKKNVPLKKFGKPQDVSIIVSVLLSNKTGFITGSNFVIDGGQTRSIG